MIPPNKVRASEPSTQSERPYTIRDLKVILASFTKSLMGPHTGSWQGNSNHLEFPIYPRVKRPSLLEVGIELLFG
jgi:hypothetical protein